LTEGEPYKWTYLLTYLYYRVSDGKTNLSFLKTKQGAALSLRMISIDGGMNSWSVFFTMIFVTRNLQPAGREYPAPKFAHTYHTRVKRMYVF